MKSIELIEDHESKLLEMCKELFPKITVHGGVYPDGKPFPKHILNYSDDDSLPYVTTNQGEDIHWFEFCMFQLSSEIYNRLFDFSAENGYDTADTGEEHFAEWNSEFYNWILFYKYNPKRIEFHPINYLYQEFKKLK